MMMILLVFFAFIVYWLGFFLRTERHLQSLIDMPWQILTSAGQDRIRGLFQDYQVIGFVANNPLLPLEPLATYGDLLSHGRIIAREVHEIASIQSDLMRWQEAHDTESLFPIMKYVFDRLWRIRTELIQIQARLQHISSPELFSQIRRGSDLLTALIDHHDIWYDLAGRNRTTRILLLNQNSDELRAGGGFPGTAFIIEFESGRMTRFDFYDIYALDWQLKGYRPAPEWINRFRSREYAGMPAEFEIRDANYFPTFQESATKIADFMQQAGFGSVDLVVGINQKFLEDLIALVEPLTIPGIPVQLDHTNAMLTISLLVEGKKSVADNESPKWSVKMLGIALLSALREKHLMHEALGIVAMHVFRGEIVAGSPHAEVQAALDDLGIFDRWRGKTGDWFSALFTSVSRNKSDRLMERTFTIEHIDTCERRLTLSQKHWYDFTERDRIADLALKLGMTDKLSTLLSIQWAGDNVQYLRFILPPGTTYLPESTSAFSLLENTPLYTSIHGYETTKPGTTSSLQIRYRLSEGHCGERTEFFKQPGLSNTRFVVKKWDTILYQTFYE
jgi:hypothetical protein